MPNTAHLLRRRLGCRQLLLQGLGEGRQLNAQQPVGGAGHVQGATAGQVQRGALQALALRGLAGQVQGAAQLLSHQRQLAQQAGGVALPGGDPGR